MGDVARARAIGDSFTEQAGFRRISTDLLKKRKENLRAGCGGCIRQEEKTDRGWKCLRSAQETVRG